MSDPKIIVALDFPDVETVLSFCKKVSPAKCKVKIGKELFTCAGPNLVQSLIDSGFDVFLDLKYHDIPNTVANACQVAANFGVWMVNVHASGGRVMLEAAREAIDKSLHKPLLIAVTVLTSLSNDDFSDLGIVNRLDEQVLLLAKLAKLSGLDGVVCSAHEAQQLSTNLGKDFCLVTPGIRLQNSSVDDQKRTTTPQFAIRSGSHYIVIGRPITQADDPSKVLDIINMQIEDTLKE